MGFSVKLRNEYPARRNNALWHYFPLSLGVVPDPTRYHPGFEWLRNGEQWSLHHGLLLIGLTMTNINLPRTQRFNEERSQSDKFLNDDES